MKIQKLTAGSALCIATIALISSCNGSKDFSHKSSTTQDCSAMFETRYIDNDKNVSFKKKGVSKSQAMMDEDDDSVAATECKLLEVKITDDIKCEVVGSNKIDSLMQILSENKDNKMILITPDKKLADLNKMAQKYMMSNGIDIKKYLDSDVFKNLSFPYKGMRCIISDKEFVMWSGKKQLIVTME